MSIQPEIAEALRVLDASASLADVASLYEPLLAAQSRAGVSVQRDQAYGRHERQRLDIYIGSQKNAQPVLVWVHGGGFIRGDKQHRENIGYWGAREGFVTVLPNYRLAPQHTWPSGAEDVIAVWHWLREHAARFGGDPRRIVLAGESAGAAHVAAAGLMRRFQPVDWQVAGLVLLSGPYNVRLDGLARSQFGISTPDLRNDAYYGADPARWAAASTVDAIDVEPFPVLIAFAERDMLQMRVHASELFARLVCQHRFVPELRVFREHNHFSSGYSIGTADRSVSDVLSRFVRSSVENTRHHSV